jgi:hypothetical protein
VVLVEQILLFALEGVQLGVVFLELRLCLFSHPARFF